MVNSKIFSFDDGFSYSSQDDDVTVLFDDLPTAINDMKGDLKRALRGMLLTDLELKKTRDENVKLINEKANLSM